VHRPLPSTPLPFAQGHQRRSNTSKHWVPLPGHKGLEGSDAENISLVDWKPCAWRNPMCAAQAHYSFFQNYRAGSLEVRGAEATRPNCELVQRAPWGQLVSPPSPSAQPCRGLNVNIQPRSALHAHVYGLSALRTGVTSIANKACSDSG